jgi:hypothetical protein
MPRLTKAELYHIKKFVDNYDYLLDLDPALFKDEDEDALKVVKQIIEEKINE